MSAPPNHQPCEPVLVEVPDSRPLSEDLVTRLRARVDDPALGIVSAWHLLEEAAECLEEAIPLLRLLTRHCENCEGAGEIVVGHAPDDYWEEPCKQCKPIWDLIERIEPPRRAIPTPAPALAAQEEDDDPF